MPSLSLLPFDRDVKTFVYDRAVAIGLARPGESRAPRARAFMSRLGPLADFIFLEVPLGPLCGDRAWLFWGGTASAARSLRRRGILFHYDGATREIFMYDRFKNAHHPGVLPKTVAEVQTILQLPLSGEPAPPRPPETIRIRSFEHWSEQDLGLFENVTDFLNKQFEAVAIRNENLPGAGLNPFNLWFDAKYRRPLEGLRSVIDAETWDYVKGIKSYIPLIQERSNLDFYNRLVRGTADEVRARRNVLEVLKPLHDYKFGGLSFFFLSAPGESRSAYEILGAELGVKSGTIKKLIREPTTIPAFFKMANVWGRENNDLIEALDTLPQHMWPRNEGEVAFFHTVREWMQTYGNLLPEDAKEKSILVWAHKIHTAACEAKSKDRPWEHFVRTQCATFHERQLRALPEGETPPSDKLEDQIRACNSAIRNMRDMMGDIKRQFLFPAAFYAIGDKAQAEEAARTLLAQWMKAGSFAHHMSANAYWHSQRTRFAERFASAVTLKDFPDWVSFISAPYEIEGDGRTVSLLPLTSSAALTEEGKEMKHCVWSYAASCKTGTSHIFSLRDKATGERLSTLQCRDGVKDEKRCLSIVQHRTKRDGLPGERAKQAAREFVRRVNEGEIVADWAAVDRSRIFFKEQKTKTKIGYDYTDPAVQQRVLAIFRPLMPPSLRQGVSDFATFVRLLGEDRAGPTRVATIRQNAVMPSPLP